MKNKMLKICIMGASTTTNNRGVSALAVSIVKILLRIKPDVQLSFITGSRDSRPQVITLANKTLFLPTIGFRLSPKAMIHRHLIFVFLLALLQRCTPSKRLRVKIINSNPLLREIYKADLVTDIQGGDSFSDIYGLVSFMLGVLPQFIVLLMQKKLVLLPQTYGPYKHLTARLLAHFIMRNAFYCFSRDKDGVRQLNNVKKGKSDFSFCPDVAFMLDPVKPKVFQIVPEIVSTSKSLVGININGLMYNGGYTRRNMFGLAIDYQALVLDIINLMIKQNSHILLIPHTYGSKDNVNSDPYACEEISLKLKCESLHTLKGEYNQSEVKSIIGMCDFFIGSRMHACIAALSQNIPTIGVAYSKKFIGVFDSVGARDMVVDCRMEDIESIKSKILNCYLKKEDFISSNKNRMKEIQNIILSEFNALLSKPTPKKNERIDQM